MKEKDTKTNEKTEKVNENNKQEAKKVNEDKKENKKTEKVNEGKKENKKSKKVKENKNENKRAKKVNEDIKENPEIERIKKAIERPEKEKKENENEDKELKKEFFQKVWFSIDKIERYPELSAEGIKSAIKYVAILVLILAVISSGIIMIKSGMQMKKFTEYLKNDAPEFSYKDETLTINAEQPKTENNDNIGKIIIDTNTEDSEQINQYIDEISEGGIVVLKNKIAVKQNKTQGVLEYSYKQFTEQTNLTEFDNNSLSEFLQSSKMNSVYSNMFFTIFVYTYVEQFLDILLYAFIVSIFGYITAFLLGLKLKYVAIYNMGVYSITLSTIFYMIYLIVNGITGFEIKYFDVMYMLISTIYIIAAIFMLKLEFNKKRDEVKKVVEVEKNEVKKEATEEEGKTTENKKKEKKEKKEDKDKENEDENGEREPN